MGRISTGMTEKKRTLLDIDPADRVRLLASATAYAAGRRTYVVGAVSDVIAANAGRLDAAAREALADAIRPAADAGDPIDAPAWTRALAALETAAPDGSDGLDGSAVDLRILLHCAFRHDMGGDAGLWARPVRGRIRAGRRARAAHPAPGAIGGRRRPCVGGRIPGVGRR